MSEENRKRKKEERRKQMKKKKKRSVEKDGHKQRGIGGKEKEERWEGDSERHDEKVEQGEGDKEERE